MVVSWTRYCKAIEWPDWRCSRIACLAIDKKVRSYIFCSTVFIILHDTVLLAGYTEGAQIVPSVTKASRRRPCPVIRTMNLASKNFCQDVVSLMYLCCCYPSSTIIYQLPETMRDVSQSSVAVVTCAPGAQIHQTISIIKRSFTVACIRSPRYRTTFFSSRSRETFLLSEKKAQFISDMFELAITSLLQVTLG